MDATAQHDINVMSSLRARSHRLMALLVGALVIVIIAMSIERILLMQTLKLSVANDRPEPFVMVPDSKTGAFTAVTRLTDIDMTMLEAAAYTEVTRFINEYERYDKWNQTEYWHSVQAKSSEDVFRKYAWRFNKDNPHSLYETVDEDRLKVRFRSWLPGSNGGMIVHFTVDRIFVGSPQKSSSLNYVARIHYEWKNAPAKFDDRVINGFGFHVTRYDTSIDNPTDVKL